MAAYLHKLVMLVAIVFIAGCANRAPTFVAAPEPADGAAVVYIYRPSASANFMMSPKVVIDGDERFGIGSGDYRYVYLHGGSHSVGLSSTDQYTTGPVLTITVDNGNSYYLRVSTLLKFEAEKMNTRKFWLDLVDEQAALTEIGATEYAGPKLQQTADGQTDEASDKQGFSVDKTQDPFAGKYR